MSPVTSTESSELATQSTSDHDPTSTNVGVPETSNAASSTPGDLADQGTPNPAPVGQGTTDASSNSSKPPAKLKITKLPTIEEIREIIPPEGCDVRELARKLGVDQTNFYLFSELIKASCNIEMSAWVKHSSKSPSTAELEEIYQSAKEPAARRELQANQVVAASLEDDVKITWEGHTELARGASKILPKAFYRVFYEDSATLTPYVTKHTHPKNRQRMNVELSPNVAFQSLGKFSLVKDITRPRIERHLCWNQKRDPSSFVSVSDSLAVAHKRAVYHSPSGTSHRIGERIAIAKIKTKGLRAVTIHGTLEEMIQTVAKDSYGLDKVVDSRSETRQVQIPAWIHKSALVSFEDETSMNLKQIEEASPEIWLSITELRHCNLKVPAARGHDYEWLAAGKILKNRITKVMPFDGEKIYYQDIGQEIRSKSSQKCWVWDWSQSTWLLAGAAEVQKQTPQSQSTTELEGFSDTGKSELVPTQEEGLENDYQGQDVSSSAKRSLPDGTLDTYSATKKVRTSEKSSNPECSNGCESCCTGGDKNEDATYASAWLHYLELQESKAVEA